MALNDTGSAFAPATNVIAGQSLASVTPPAGYIQCDAYVTITGSGSTSADNFNVGLYVGGVLKATLMNVQSAQNTSPIVQSHWYTVDGATAVELRVIGAPGAATVTYDANLKCTRRGLS